MVPAGRRGNVAVASGRGFPSGADDPGLLRTPANGFNAFAPKGIREGSEPMAPGRAKRAPGEGRVGIGIGVAIGIENEVEPEVRTLGRSD